MPKRVDAKSTLEEIYLARAIVYGFPVPETQYRFAAIAVGGTGKGLRKRLAVYGLQDWRFDFAWPDRMLAVEIDGGIWTGGRHVRGAGFEGDCRKMNAAILLGWHVLHFTADMVNCGEAISVTQKALGRFYPSDIKGI